ncbi:putative boron transporter 2 [Iris pallida]|uniref:Boron transporter 2 n=1 Tax=Iris pallida TaxID=29817 RepID=A0AAX6GKK6_IRIPA|nr:putative boron transporter 2 [Iris pallida]
MGKIEGNKFVSMGFKNLKFQIVKEYIKKWNSTRSIGLIGCSLLIQRHVPPRTELLVLNHLKLGRFNKARFCRRGLLSSMEVQVDEVIAQFPPTWCQKVIEVDEK